ncbi:hypothetical protein DRO54_05895 [Candidatus Bathyarchaeota archaeon]|nr:MAG: hypothetical protein DRO54_05895 [Candidatus Bathyarchaeota archaeon]
MLSLHLTNDQASLKIVAAILYSETSKIFLVNNLSNGKCPRCGAEAVELGTPVIQVGKTRQMRISVKQCPKCLLVFYEGLETQ